MLIGIYRQNHYTHKLHTVTINAQIGSMTSQSIINAHIDRMPSQPLHT